MTYKTILACLTTEEASSHIMPIACSISERFQAHLVGIHTLEAIVPYPGIALHTDHPLFKEFNDQAKAEDARIENVFSSYVSDKSFTSEWRSLKARSWRASDQLVQSAFRADLIIVAQSDREHERVDQFGVQNDLIINSGRPVLLVPPENSETKLGSRILLAWNATKESAVATQNALPFLRAAEAVTILTVSSAQPYAIETDVEGHEVAKYLSRHSVNAEVKHIKQTEPSVGEQILKEAKVGGYDLIAMGAFGHSRLHSYFFGDASRYLLEKTELPILYGS